MKKLLFLISVGLLIFLGYLFAKEPFDSLRSLRVNQSSDKPKEIVMKIGLVADSHSENELLARALTQARDRQVDFVIGLGDWTNLGTIEELEAAKKVFDDSGLEYFVTAGDRDGWESRQKGEANSANFVKVFYPYCHSRESENQDPRIKSEDDGECSTSLLFVRNSIQFIILDNSDIYKGIDSESWDVLNQALSNNTSQDGQIGGNSKFAIRNSKLVFVFTHKTPFHPDSSHIMGEDSPQVAEQARRLLGLIEATRPCHSRESGNQILNRVEDDSHQVEDDSNQVDYDKMCPCVDGFFSGDLHFFAQFSASGGSPGQSVKITTVGAVASERNFQGPRFAILKVFDDYSWQVEDIEIK